MAISKDAGSIFGQTRHDDLLDALRDPDKYKTYPTQSDNMWIGTAARSEENKPAPPAALTIYRAKIGFVVAPLGWPNIDARQGSTVDSLMAHVAVFSDLDAAQNYITLELTRFNGEK